MGDIDDAMGTDTKRKSKRKPPAQDYESAKVAVATEPRRVRAGQTCPKCNRGRIGVVRTRLDRSKNRKTTILGCRSQQCLWDLDGDNIRVTPINPGRVMTE